MEKTYVIDISRVEPNTSLFIVLLQGVCSCQSWTNKENRPAVKHKQLRNISWDFLTF